MIRLKLTLDKDAEIAWLNELADQGWAMKHFFCGIYMFERCEAGAYRYQIEFNKQFGKMDDEYKELMQEMGIEVVQRWGFWIILRKKAEDGAFTLYTDVHSQREHYEKINRMFQAIMLLELIAFLVEAFSYAETGGNLMLGGMLLIGAILLGFIRIVTKTRKIINQLKEQETGIPVEERQAPHALVPIGLLINTTSIIIKEQISDWISISVSVLALAMMGYGLYKTTQARNNRKNHNEEQ